MIIFQDGFSSTVTTLQVHPQSLCNENKDPIIAITPSLVVPYIITSVTASDYEQKLI